MNHSLQQILNRRILTATALFALLASAISGWLAFNEARELQDNLLRQAAALVDSHTINSAQTFPRSEPRAYPEDMLVLQSLGATNLGTSANSLPIPVELNDGLYTLNLNDIGWRVLIVTQKNNDKLPAQRFAISQQTEARDEVAWTSSLHTLLPVLLLVPILMGIVTYAIKQSIQPISDLAQELDERDESNLELLPKHSIPTELAPFIESINRLLKRLKRAIELQRRFVADAAHELRTPVTGLSLLADNLARATTMTEIQERLIPLQAGLQRTQQLVVQLLDFARLQSEASAKNQPINLQDIVQEVIAELYPFAEHKSIDLGMLRNESLQVMGTKTSLRTLTHNAIDNALRYTPNHGKVDVSLYALDGFAILEIEDTGCGIPVEDITHVFEAFYRVGVNTEPGTGLGLAITQEIANRLGGKIYLENRPEGGLRFRYIQGLYLNTKINSPACV
jgi:signal transduction histidine kinase